MRWIEACCLLLLIVCLGSSQPARYLGTVYMSGTTTINYEAGVLDKVNGTAWAVFDDGEYETSQNGTGWGVLYINTNPNNVQTLDDASILYAAGYLEGAITYQQILNNYNNYFFGFFGSSSMPKKVKTFLTDNLSYLRQQVTQQSGTSQYWNEVNLLLNQFDGILDGYNSVASSSNQLTDIDLLLINGNGDMDDIIDAVGVSLTDARRVRYHRDPTTGDPIPGFFNDHCSASVRVTSGNADMFFGHDTWSSYDQMTRIYKHLEFKLNRTASNPDGARRISFSSSPGFISSTDDWYLTNQGLAVFETTNEFYNQSMYNQIKSTGSILSFWRAMLANYNAVDGPSWIQWFCNQNSGTYNNQWMILDLSLFQPNMASLPDNLLWITEQIPGFCQSADVTSFIRTNGYWASYNIPYFTYIYDVSGFLSEYKKNGDDYSWSNCARAKIFARDAVKVTDYAGYQTLMNSNDYKNDPLSGGDPQNQIMARGDLEKKFSVPSGGIDSKTSTWSRGLLLEADAINGPTHQSLPAFQWSAFSGIPHAGQPSVFDYSWVAMSPSNSAKDTFDVKLPPLKQLEPQTSPAIAPVAAPTPTPANAGNNNAFPSNDGLPTAELISVALM